MFFKKRQKEQEQEVKKEKVLDKKDVQQPGLETPPGSDEKSSVTLEKPIILEKKGISIDQEIEKITEQFKVTIEKYNEVRLNLQNKLFENKDMIEKSIVKNSEELARIKEIRAKLQADRAELEKLNDQEVQEEIASIKSLIQDNESDLAKKNKDIDLQKDLLKKAKQEAVDVHAQIVKLQQDEASIAKRMHDETDPMVIVRIADEFREKLNVIRGSLDNEEEAFEKLNNTIDQQQETLNTLNSDKKEFEKISADYKDKIVELQSEGKKIERDRDSQIKQIDLDLKSLDLQSKRFENLVTEDQEKLAKNSHLIEKWIGTPTRIEPFKVGSNDYVLNLDSFLPNRVSEIKTVVERLLEIGVPRIGFFTFRMDLNFPLEVQIWAEQNDISAEKIYPVNLLAGLTANEQPTSPVILVPEVENGAETWENGVLKIKMNDSGLQMAVYYLEENTEHERNNPISYVEYTNNGKVIKRSYISDDNRLAANAMYNDEEVLEREEYFRKDGSMIFTMYYGENGLTGIEMFDKSGILERAFNSLNDLNHWWLKQNVSNHPTNFITGVLDGELDAISGIEHLSIIPFVTTDTLATKKNTQLVMKVDTDKFILEDQDLKQKLLDSSDKSLEILSLEDQTISIVTPA